MKLLVFLVLMGFGILFFSMNNVMAQQVITEPVKEQVQQQAQQAVTAQTLPIDLTTITGIIGTAGGLLWKDKKDKEALTEQLKECMEILMSYVAADAKVHNAAIIYPEKTHSQLLQLKANNTGLDDRTIAGEIAEPINRLSKFMFINFQLPMPNMSIPSAQLINSTTLNPLNKVNTNTIPITPSNNQTEPKK